MTDNEREYQDLLIRLDTRMANMEEFVTDIKKFFNDRKCGVNDERIKALEWIVRIAIGSSVVSAIKAFWPSGG